MSTEERLRDALEASANTVCEETLRPLTGGGQVPRRWLRSAAPVAAALAVLLVVGVVEVVVRTVAGPGGTASGASSAGPGQAGHQPAAIGRGVWRGSGPTESTCRPWVSPATSGRPAGPLTKDATQVANGSVGGQDWSLWAKKGISPPNAVEAGGVVLAGRWYGLCTGEPDVAEFELVNAGAHGFVIGFVQWPALPTVRLTSTARLPGPTVIGVDSMFFLIDELPRSACSYPTMTLTAAAGHGYSAEHQLRFGRCAPGKLVQVTSGSGTWRPNSGSRSPAAAKIPVASPGSANAPAGTCSMAGTAHRGGQPAGPLTASSMRVATGSTGGQGWALWAKRGAGGVSGVANDGLVVDGRWYGLCLTGPNPLEFQLLEVGGNGLVYGYVASPGAYTLRTAPAGALAGIQIERVPGGTFFIGQLAKPACSDASLTLYAKADSGTDMRQLGFGACHEGQLAPIVTGQGSW